MPTAKRRSLRRELKASAQIAALRSELYGKLLRQPYFRRSARDWLGAKLHAQSCIPSDRFWCLFGMMDQYSEMMLLMKEEFDALLPKL